MQYNIHLEVTFSSVRDTLDLVLLYGTIILDVVQSSMILLRLERIWRYHDAFLSSNPVSMIFFCFDEKYIINSDEALTTGLHLETYRFSSRSSIVFVKNNNNTL